MNSRRTSGRTAGSPRRSSSTSTGAAARHRTARPSACAARSSPTACGPTARRTRRGGSSSSTTSTRTTGRSARPTSTGPSDAAAWNQQKPRGIKSQPYGARRSQRFTEVHRKPQRRPATLGARERSVGGEWIRSALSVLGFARGGAFLAFVEGAVHRGRQRLDAGASRDRREGGTRRAWSGRTRRRNRRRWSRRRRCRRSSRPASARSGARRLAAEVAAAERDGLAELRRCRRSTGSTCHPPPRSLGSSARLDEDAEAASEGATNEARSRCGGASSGARRADSAS